MKLISKLTTSELVHKLVPPTGKIRMVLDTDTYNEVDDQFALAYALRSPEKLTLEAVYAAPFHNDRSSSPEDGMEKSYDEILKIFNFMHMSSENLVYKGSRGYLANEDTFQESSAARDLVKRAMACGDEPLYVVAIGAITNVASAILMEPAIVDKIVIVWLGGNALNWPDTKEFNLYQDIPAARVIFDSGVPVVQIPCAGVTTHLLTTIPELETYLLGKSEIGTYLTEIVKGYTNEPYAWSKVIWDISAIAWLINPEWLPSTLTHSPIVTKEGTYSIDTSRHFIRYVNHMDRDKIFGHMFKKLADV